MKTTPEHEKRGMLQINHTDRREVSLTGPVSAATARNISGHYYMDRRATAEYMGVSGKFLASHLHDGPPRLRIGGKVLYRLRDVDSWMMQQLQK